VGILPYILGSLLHGTESKTLDVNTAENFVREPSSYTTSLCSSDFRNLLDQYVRKIYISRSALGFTFSHNI
jgi:hypothetical protein